MSEKRIANAEDEFAKALIQRVSGWLQLLGLAESDTPRHVRVYQLISAQPDCIYLARKDNGCANGILKEA